SQRRNRLRQWRDYVSDPASHQPCPDPLLDEVLALAPRYGFETGLLLELIDGVSSDLDRTRFQTFDELRRYCYQVASAVGLVSIKIFGYSDEGCRSYAIHLGYALQLTNILRDIGQDAQESGRIYLPLEELRHFGVSEDDLFAGHRTPAMMALLDHQYQRAKRYYLLAEKDLPETDRNRMVAAEMMAQIYSEILEKLHREQYPVFTTRCRLHPLRKAAILAAYLVRSLIGAV
ncbi:MAG: squalene/phytoene synthase family protein, partial [Verrucomicrobiales bacterium]|nr:squalene/phytoene synthase family protein [Verrucomicrobiales bacterium]